MTLTPMRCPYCNGKSIEAQRTYTIQCSAPRTLYHCAPCARSFSETRHRLPGRIREIFGGSVIL
jgi:DNA-directed RNA polymerase subunit RPC12/RpoP